jgi:hypothetical protein
MTFNFSQKHLFETEENKYRRRLGAHGIARKAAKTERIRVEVGRSGPKLRPFVGEPERNPEDW